MALESDPVYRHARILQTLHEGVNGFTLGVPVFGVVIVVKMPRVGVGLPGPGKNPANIVVAEGQTPKILVFAFPVGTGRA